ncbi:ABC transporter G family member 31 [Phytophthora fragariae]|uniref:ABC transporter G family member 31 n=1 Tax=Phytophthora fragariae TaxID=53985 RepID=A0A6A4EME0_9STRA|nr:ABC transporter G family member 31 [Phytophthora fragariae]KAE9241954.1 ABC transporter G family member 31 [Phytophthora fragariae]KAE9328666.1 ABC transporter G family member 31 [Phytophthora fragariae]
MTQDEDKMKLLQPEAADGGKAVPEVYRSLNFRSLQDPYSHGAGDTMASRYSTLRADNLETMLNGGLERFYQKYEHLSRKINLQLPTPEVRFERLAFSVQVPASAEDHGTVGSHLRGIFTPWRRPAMVSKHALHPMSGVIKPGSLTLILANPGAGKSTFLKALAGKLKSSAKTKLGGQVLYSGLRGDEIDLIKLAGLVDQTDNHIATLTVRETFKFADMCVNGRPEDQPEEMRDIAALRTELFLQILGMEECADTVVGDALLRGVSGGERKRVTIGEVLVGGQSLFLCDEISTGLDSAATFDIIKSMRTWCKTLGGSAVIALLQPTPEVVEMFDDILMINEGHMMYHGPRTEILDYFEEKGFTCPPRVDPADFLIEVTSGRGQRYANGSIPVKDLPVSSEDFNNLFCQSAIYKKTDEAISKGFNEHQFESPEDFKKAKSVANLARSKEKSEFGLAFVPSTLLLLNRQKLVWLRDPPLLWGKLIEALIIGLVMGMIYFNVNSTYYLRMIFFSIALFQRQAWQQITISFQLRKVFYKQRPRNFFRTSSYAIAESIVQIPVNMAVSFVLGTFFYFMSGLTRTFEKYIVFYLVLLCFQHAISAYMTMLSSLAPSITIGQALAAISVSFFLLFSGNIILADLIPDYWIWMYWFSPISWALRANMLSEFSSDRYSPAVSKAQLESFSIKQGTGYIWFGIAVLIVYYFVFTSFNALALHFIRYEKFKGVSAKAMKQEEEAHNVYVEVSTPTPDGQGVGSTKAKGGGLPFTPSNLCIKDLDYYVTLPSGEERQLLRKITAHFEPGRMVALMGATGAGKTTLMDGGYAAYFGDLGVDSVKMLEYFASIPGTEEIRPQYNPATYMLEVIGAGIGRDVKDYSVEYKNSELYRKNRERTLELCEVSDEFVRHSTLNYRPIATGFWNQLGELTKKQRLTYWRNPQYNFMRVFLFPIFAVIFGTTFYQLSAGSVKKINSHIGLIYNSMDFIGVTNLMTVIEVTCAERAVYYRERMSNYYSPLPYSLSLWFAEIPYLIVVIILFVTIEYWLVGWSDNAGDFFFFLFVFYLYTSACTYIGQWMSALMPNEKVANVAVGALSCLFNLFSGYLLPRTAMKAGYKWFTYLMPSSYSLAALVGVQFGDNQDIIAVTSGNVTTNMTVAHYIEKTYDFRPERKYNFMVGLIVIWFVVQLAIYLTFKYVSHLKR